MTTDSMHSRVARNIRAVLDGRGMSQAGLACLLGMSASGLSKLLNGHIPMTVDHVGRIALAVNVDPFDLFITNFVSNTSEDPQAVQSSRDLLKPPSSKTI